MTDKLLQMCKDACEAALAYDKAIQAVAPKGESWVSGDNLDRLYLKWLTLSRAALRALEESGV